MSTAGRFVVLRNKPRVLGLFQHQIESNGFERSPTSLPGHENRRYLHGEDVFEGRAVGVGWSREEQAKQELRAQRRGHWEELIERRRAADEEERERLVQAQQQRLLEEAVVRRKASIDAEREHEAEAAVRREKALELLAQEGKPSTLHRMRSMMNSEMGRELPHDDYP